MNLIDLLIPLKLKENTINYILLKGKSESFLTLSEQDFTRFSEECCSFLQKVLQLEKMVFEERRYKQLFRVTEKVHSTMNTESVLGEIFSRLKQFIQPTPTLFYYHRIIGIMKACLLKNYNMMVKIWLSCNHM